MSSAADPEPTSPLAASAERAISLASDSPFRARELAESVRESAVAERDADAEAVAERALGLAALELKDGGTALSHLRRAVRIATQARLDIRAAEARMSLGRALLYTGDARGAFREVDLAAASLDGGLPAARVQLQRALFLHEQGRLDEALAGYQQALVVFRRHGDRLREARVLNNRGILQADRGNLAAADADLAASAAICTELRLDLYVADSEHNLGWVAARRGDVPAALAYYDRSLARLRAHDVPLANRPNQLADRCELLLKVRLVAEARAAAEQAVTELTAGGMAWETAEARLMLAEAALLDGDVGRARVEADTAARAFARQQRPRWTVLARYTALRALFLELGPSTARLRAARRSAAALSGAGWTVTALDAHLLSARIALALGQTRAAANALGRVRVTSRDPVDLRVRAAHATALLAVAGGDRRRAYGALRTGIRLLHEYRGAFGATELRAQVGGQAEELGQLGLRLALEERSPRRVLEWSEAYRAGALRLRPVRPPEDADFAGELAELRRVVAEIQAATLAGGENRELLREQAAIEDAIRQRSRRTPGSVQLAPVTAPSTGQLQQLLGERALVTYVQLDDDLHAVTLADGRLRLHSLGGAAEVRAELDALRFGLRRLARADGAPASRNALFDSARHAASRLESLLLRAVVPAIDERPLVIVPTQALHAVPWSVVPGLEGRSVTIAPSVAAWAGAESRRAGLAHGKHVVVAAGPGLPFAEKEARAIAGVQGVRPLLGRDATATAVLSALEGAGTAHLAAHGSFRTDNPLFSSLRFADGPLTVYDLESLESPPDLCILSACEAGLSDVRPGDELMGLAVSLLAAGTTTIVASVVDVPDEATADLMLAFHRLLAAGLDPSRALAQAQTATGAIDDDRAFVPRAGFVCFGTG